MPVLTGGCFCGRVRYAARAEPFHGTICHCRDCRRAVGAASVARFSLARDALRFEGEAPSAFRSSAQVTRRFCGACGTALSYERDDLPDEIDLTTASLDDPEAVPPRDQTFVADRLRWSAIDGLPTFAGAREQP